MQIKASAPGKVILFGEHAVVYGKPAIAIAVKKYAHVTIKKRSDLQINLEIIDLGVSASLNIQDESINCQNKQTETGILKYVLKALKLIHDEDKSPEESPKGMDIQLEIEMPVGAGLGSSAAVTVATLAAANRYYETDLKLEEIAALAHQVELEVQKAASPIDTTLSTYGGAIYLEKNAKRIEKLTLNWELPLVIGHTFREGNTAELVNGVRERWEEYPSIMDPIFESIEQVTIEAKQALLKKDEKKLGELMNINHGLLDTLGVNTNALSCMVYQAREAGAFGSKITGAGGGGSIIALCPDRIDEVLLVLQRIENAFKAYITYEGVRTKVIE
jgi:mevalonate kinase